jgi:hypothetical protein
MLFFITTLFYFFTNTAHIKVIKFYPPDLSNIVKDYNYGGIVNAFLSLHFKVNGQYIPNAKFASQLMIAMRSNPDIKNPSVLDRIEFLLKKQHPHRSHEYVLSLFWHFVIYKQIIDLFHDISVTSESTRDYYDLTNYIVLLQDNFFGRDLASRLFGDQRRMRILLESKQSRSVVNQYW